MDYAAINAQWTMLPLFVKIHWWHDDVVEGKITPMSRKGNYPPRCILPGRFVIREVAHSK